MIETLEPFYQQLLNMPSGNRFCRGDLHVHTPKSWDYRERSKHTVQEVLQEAVAKGLDFVALTDHNCADGYAEVYPELAAGKWPLTVFPGVEITCPGGKGGIHLLALFEPGTAVDVIHELLVLVGIGHRTRGRQEAISDKTLEHILKEIERKGGIAIAAHVNSPNGILGGMTSANQRKPPLASGTLHALEITGQAEAASVRKQWRRPIALVQGSDAHTPRDVGKRSCRIKMNRPSLEGLKAAFAEPELRVGADENAHKVVMEGLVIEGGFFSLDGGHLAIRFHESFNCLVGGRGAGKSTVVEAINCCLSADTDVLRTYEMERASLFVRIDQEHYALELSESGRREWKRNAVGKWRRVALPPGALSAIYSQGAFYNQAKGNSLMQIIDEVASEPVAVKRVKRDHAATMWKLLDTDRRPYQDAYLIRLLVEAEKTLAEHLKLSDDKYSETPLDTSFVMELVNMQYEFESRDVPSEALKAVINPAIGLAEDEVEHRRLIERPTEISKEFYTDFLQSPDAQALLTALGEIRADLELKDAPLLVQGEHAQICNEVLELLALEDNLFSLREGSVGNINVRCDGTLLIKLDKQVNSGAYQELLRMAGIDAATAASIQQRLDPRTLMRALIRRQGIPRAIRAQADEILLRLLTTHGISRWLDCWRSKPIVKLPGMTRFQSLDRLSIGQQCTALLNLALVSGDTSLPLIIDQPEDHLDNLSVNESLVSTVRSARQQRQIIFATHNANLAVLGDTDLFSVLGQKDDGGALVCSGSLQDAAVRTWVVKVLEGGQQALQGRLTKYGG